MNLPESAFIKHPFLARRPPEELAIEKEIGRSPVLRGPQLWERRIVQSSLESAFRDASQECAGSRGGTADLASGEEGRDQMFRGKHVQDPSDIPDPRTKGGGSSQILWNILFGKSQRGKEKVGILVYFEFCLH